MKTIKTKLKGNQKTNVKYQCLIRNTGAHTQTQRKNKITHTKNTNQNITNRAREETVISRRALNTSHTTTLQ